MATWAWWPIQMRYFEFDETSGLANLLCAFRKAFLERLNADLTSLLFLRAGFPLGFTQSGCPRRCLGARSFEADRGDLGPNT